VRRRIGNLGRFGTLLVVLVFFIAFAPFIGDDREGFPRYGAVFTLVMLASVYAVSQRRRVLFVGVSLAMPAIGFRGVQLIDPSPWWILAHTLAEVALLGFVVSVLLRAILSSNRVTTDTIFGGICIYLLLGVVWAEMYQCLEALQPGSFEIGRSAAVREALEVPATQALLFVYFSFVTLTTLGYGEIYPIAPEAQTLVVLEAVSGPLFLAIFIARLVGLHMASLQRPDG